MLFITDDISSLIENVVSIIATANPPPYMYCGLEFARFFFALLADYLDMSDVHVLYVLRHVQKHFYSATLFPCVNVRVTSDHVSARTAPQRAVY